MGKHNRVRAHIQRITMNSTSRIMLGAMPRLESERIVLRKFEKRDASDMYEYASMPEVTRFLTWEVHPNPSYTKEYIKFLRKKYKKGEFLDWGLEYKLNGKLIGSCGFTSVDFDSSSAEIGYVINPKYWKMGLGSEAVKTVLDYAMNSVELNRICARVMEGNIASVSLLEKCGFKYEGKGKQELFSKGEYKNILHFAICRDEIK